jgi:hypothetical protein
VSEIVQSMLPVRTPFLVSESTTISCGTSSRNFNLVMWWYVLLALALFIQ